MNKKVEIKVNKNIGVITISNPPVNSLSVDLVNDINKISSDMKKVNPRYTWREWLISFAYKAAERGDFSLIKELQVVFDNPYEDLSIDLQNKYDLIRPLKFFNKGGISHYSCSS